MPGDSDVDIGIYDPGFDMRAFAKQLPVTRYYGLGTWTNMATISLETTVEVYQVFDHAGQVAETLYHFDRNLLKFLVYPKEIFETGVTRALFCGVECNVLKRAHEYCVVHYGEDYLIPNPGYHWWDDPKNAVVMEPERMFTEEVPRSAGAFGRPWRFQPTTTARGALGRLHRLLAPVVSRHEQAERTHKM